MWYVADRIWHVAFRVFPTYDILHTKYDLPNDLRPEILLALELDLEGF